MQLQMPTRIERRPIYNSFVAGLIIVLISSSTVTAQSLRGKLDQETDYHVHALKPDEQLIEVVRHFQIPIAIEWLAQSNEQVSNTIFEHGSVLDLIKAILHSTPHESIIVEDRILRVFAPAAFKSPLNFLNLRLENFCVSHESVYGADFDMRVGIDEKLYPEYFKNGFNGGYGGSGNLMTMNSITICLNNASIREILTEIAAQSGRAGWIVTLKPEELQGKKPFWRGVPINEYDTSPLTGRWHFFEVAEEERQPVH